MAKDLGTEISTRLRKLRPNDGGEQASAPEASEPDAPAQADEPIAAQPAVPPPRRDPEPQPRRLLGELSRASESLAEVLDSMTGEKRELEARTNRLEEELVQARKEAADARDSAAAEVERARDESSAQLARAARMAAREHARAARVEQLLATVGGLRETAAFCITVPRHRRRQATRELLTQAVSDGVHLRLTAHASWRDTLLLADADGDASSLARFLTWARGHFSDDDFRERQT